MKLHERLLSIAEITALEDSFSLGVPSLGVAASALEDRWEQGVRDSETIVRLLFLRWYAGVEQEQHTGLSLAGPQPSSLVSELGGDENLLPEAQFCLGYMARFFPWAVGKLDEWEGRWRPLCLLATGASPESALFSDWNYFMGSAKDTEHLRTSLRKEVHARFHGRGEFGRYFHHVFSARLSD